LLILLIFAFTLEMLRKMNVIDELRQEINKKRWEKWRLQQKTKREKTYCYWGEWSDSCEDIDTGSPYCAYAEIKATLYAASDKVKVHYIGRCCEGNECGNCIAINPCYVKTKICTTEIINSGYCTPWQQENFGYGVCNKSGDHWHDIRQGYEEYEHEAHVYVDCNCAAASDSKHASCRVQAQ
jgi:hypothetical protein